MAGALLASAATAAIPLVQRQIIDNVIVHRRESIWPLAGLLVIPLLQRTIIDDVIITPRDSILVLAIGLLAAAAVNFGAVYAPDTTQNHPNAPGLFHFWLKRGFDTSRYPDGSYALEVEASDVRGNPSTGNLAVTFDNAQ